MFMYLWKKTQASLFYVKIGLCAIVVYLLIFAIFSRVFQTNNANIYAAKQTPVNKTDKIRAFITDKKLNSTQTGKMVVSLYKSVTCSLIGEACYENLDKKNPSNVSMTIASVFAYPFMNPPASGVGVTIETLAQAGFIPKSYAAEGVGFASLRPIMGVWKAMRDVAYLILVLVIVTIGFMIMLRSKINPQTIVNVENSLPKIIMSLIYITFSFAIAGFLIDLMYVSIVLVIAILGPQYTAVAPSTQYVLLGGPRTTQDLMKTFLHAAPLDIAGLLFNFDFWNIFWILPTAILNILGDGISIILRTLITIGTTLVAIPIINKALAIFTKPDVEAGAALIGTLTVAKIITFVTSSITGVISFFVALTIGLLIAPLVLGLIIFLTILLLFFRIFSLLFSNYIKLFILIIISPLFLMMEAIPGQSTFTAWIRNLLEILIPFPVIIATFLIGAIIMGISTSGKLFAPPFLMGLNAEWLSPIIGMWILFMIPDFVAIAQKAINPKPLPLEGGLGTFFGGAKTGISTGLEQAGKYALLASRVAPIGKIFDMLGMKDGTGRQTK